MAINPTLPVDGADPWGDTLNAALTTIITEVNTNTTDVATATTTANAAIPTTAKGANNGVATLDSGGDVPLSQLGNVPGGGGTTLPADAAGWLHDNGSGTLAWTTPSKSDVGLGSADNTADTAKPVSTAQAAADATVLASAATDATTKANAAAAASQPLDSDLTTIGGFSSAAVRAIASDGSGWVSKTVTQFRTWLGLATVAISGAYADLTGTPTLGTASTHATGDFAQVANNLSDVVAATARTNLGLGTIATQSQAAFCKTANNLSDVASASTSRTSLGLGTSATQDKVAAGAAGVLDATASIPESQVTNLTTDLAAKAPLASPTLTGTPLAPTPTAGDSTTKIGTTAFITGAIATQHTADNAAYVAQLPGPSGDTSGATDRAAINTILAAGGKILPHQAGGVYYLDAPLKLAAGGNTDVDFGSMYFNLVGMHNFLQNAEVIPTNNATDVATTIGSSVIVSATLAAAGAAIGHQVGVEGAGAIGGDASAQPMWLYGTITAVSGNNITLGGNVNGVAAHATLSGKTGHLFKTRATNIKVRGGIYDAGTVWGTGYGMGAGTRWTAANDSSFLRFRRVDGLYVEGATFKQTSFPVGGGWCFGVDPADVTSFVIERITPVGSSTAVNGTGPLSRGIVRNIQGQSQDDMVAFGTVGASYTDTEGDISDILIDGVMSNGSLRCVDLYAGQGAHSATRPFTNFRVKSCKGSCQGDAVAIVNYAGNATMNGAADDITASFGSLGTGGPYYLVNVPSGQAGIVVTGPTPPGTELLAVKVTTNVTSISTGTTVATLTSVPVPPSGSLILEVNAYAFQQFTGPGVPALYITASGWAGNIISCGQTATNALTPSVGKRSKVTGLTPGSTVTFTLTAATNAGTSATLFADAAYPLEFRALVA